MDKATTFRQWLSDLVHLKNHVTIAGLIVAGVGIYLEFIPYLGSHIAGIMNIVIGSGVVVDEAAHLYTN